MLDVSIIGSAAPAGEMIASFIVSNIDSPLSSIYFKLFPLQFL
jgi:hypothetical protein